MANSIIKVLLGILALGAGVFVGRVAFDGCGPSPTPIDAAVSKDAPSLAPCDRIVGGTDAGHSSDDR